MAYKKVKTESYENLGGINSKASAYVNDKTEFRNLVNVNFFVPGSLSKRPGTSMYVGASVAGRLTGVYEFERLNGASYLIATANTNAYTVTPSSFTAFKTGLTNGNLFDFVTFTDRLFACNGSEFFKFDGSNTTNFGLPVPPAGWGVTTTAGGSLAAGVTTSFVFSYGYLNDRGFYGPGATGITIVVSGQAAQNSVLFYGLTTPASYGISALAFYRSAPNGVTPVGTTLAAAGALTFADPGFPLTTRELPGNINFTLIPKFMEIYNNQLFMGGFSGALSTAVWSEIGDPESIDPSYNAEFRTNDGDKLSGFKAYGGALVVTKERSTHRVTGDDPSNFLLQEISDQYGCISNRAMVGFENVVWFLDSKGICEYDGANIAIISNKVEPVFQSMNLTAARENACAVHYRDLNEVWFAIPIDGATKNNCVVAFDYLAKAWTTYKGVDISSLAMIKGANAAKTPFTGSYTGGIAFFSPSLMSDLGQAITCTIDSRFISPSGHSTELMYRRFYLDVDPVLGVTSPITINLKQDFGTSIIATRTMYQAPFQSRIDFGIPAKSIQAQIIHSSASLPFKMNGFTFETRFQRAV